MHPGIHPALGFRAGGGAMLEAPFCAGRLMPSMASTLRFPVSGVMLSPPPREGASDSAPFSTVAMPLRGSLLCPGFTLPLRTCRGHSRHQNTITHHGMKHGCMLFLPSSGNAGPPRSPSQGTPVTERVDAACRNRLAECICRSKLPHSRRHAMQEAPCCRARLSAVASATYRAPWRWDISWPGCA